MRLLFVCIVLLVALIVGGLGTRAYLEQGSARVEGRAVTPQTMAERTITARQNAPARNLYRGEDQALLGEAFLARVRENGDPNHYARAEQAFIKALERDANNTLAIQGMGQLALARHQFREALTWGERARALNPDDASVYGILGDAHLELGEYDAAFEQFQTMVNMRPDLASYARVSYARELVGDHDGAIANMQRAVNAGAAHSEARSWALVQLGHLYFGGGKLEDARRAYQAALQDWNEYPYARAGLAQVYAAQGEYAQAIEIYTRLKATLPLPEFVIALGEVYRASGDTANAQEQFALVAPMQQLYQANGVDTDAEMALFRADRRIDLAATLELARRAYGKRPTIFVADTLAWAYYQVGDYKAAQEMMRQALRLNTENALMFFHAGMIYQAVGNNERAREFLERAVALNPRFSVRYAGEAEKVLGELEEGGREGGREGRTRNEKRKARADGRGRETSSVKLDGLYGQRLVLAR